MKLLSDQRLKMKMVGIDGKRTSTDMAKRSSDGEGS